MAVMKWFTRSLADAEGFRHPQMGIAYMFGEAYPRELYEDYGINLRVLEPGQPASLYHAESVDESFLVLDGECLAIVEGEQVTLRQWDYLHCPPDTAHLIVGAGDGPSTVLMVGGRVRDTKVRFPVNEDAAKYGASVERETDDAQDAWAQRGWTLEDFEPAKLPWPPS